MIRKWAIITLLIIALAMAADATYKEIKVGDGKFTASFDIKGDPVDPVEGETEDQAGFQLYEILLRDNEGKNRTRIEILVSGSGIQEIGSIKDLLRGFSDVKEYSREIDGQLADVATGLGWDGIHKWTVFSYYLDYRNRKGLYTNMVLVRCALPEESAGDLMNTLHIGKRF